MAVWQASFHVVLPTGALPSDYRERLESLLPAGESWDGQIEMWGHEEGDRLEVFTDDVPPPEILVRFDLRVWRPQLYERFLAYVASIGGRLRSTGEDVDVDVPLTLEAFMGHLGTSRAARFVKDPEAYFRELEANPIRMREEP